MHNRTFRAVLAAIFVAVMLAACSSKPGPATTNGQLKPVYDKTGKLKMLTFDSKKDGKIDTWTYMEGDRIARIEQDRDGDGKVDRWEYYDAQQRLSKVGMSSVNDGKVDRWAYPDAEGRLARIEIAVARDDKITRIEYYEPGNQAPARVEEDTDGDGKIDKWETYRNGSLATVAFDETHKGVPTRRLTYRADGTVQVEVDPLGTGKFVAK
jgi:antitoxin component YwqK of YwqJK toxin-antitoxin module